MEHSLQTNQNSSSNRHVVSDRTGLVAALQALMLWLIAKEIVLVVLTERQIEDADYKLVPRFLMRVKQTKKVRRFSVAFSVVPDIS